jgi:hypothetical protein
MSWISDGSSSNGTCKHRSGRNGTRHPQGRLDTARSGPGSCVAQLNQYGNRAGRRCLGKRGLYNLPCLDRIDPAQKFEARVSGHFVGEPCEAARAQKRVGNNQPRYSDAAFHAELRLIGDTDRPAAGEE